MHIKKKRVLNVADYLSAIPSDSQFRIAFEVKGGHEAVLTKAGFTIPPTLGDTVLPTAIGPVSRFNSEGRWRINRDGPKEQRYIRTIHWRWKQWSGRGQYEEKEDDRDIYRDCFPRDFIVPPSVELTYAASGQRHLITSPVYTNKETQHEDIRHVINLFLEVWGECELVNVTLVPLVNTQVRKVHWRMLPPGDRPWEQIETHLKQVLKGSSADTRTMIIDRAKTIMDFQPNLQVVGLGGFSDYMAYVFADQDIVVLESIRKDNAIYVFGKDWKDFSRLSKAEILSNGFHLQRIVHTKGWKARLAKLLKKPAGEVQFVLTGN